MAAATITDSQRELISSLPPDDIPIKLRCANCSKLAVNAFRLPCCEQAICETCHANLPASCPVCEHSPLSADDCKVHKSLRTTVRVFLRSEEKKRDNLKLKEAKEQAAEVKEATPAAETSQEQAEGQDEVEATPAAATTQGEEQGDQPAANEHAKAEETQEGALNGIPQDAAAADEKEQRTADKQVAEVNDDETKEPAKEVGEGVGDAENNAADEDSKAQVGPGGNPAFDAANGGFPNMGFAGAGDFNQMQMMLAMQNGMQPGAFGGFPMMGMPGMNMDPMTMQNMYMNMNGGYNQGMGMNMGMAGYGGGGENWSEQQASWNSFGQDNYNHANSLGMGAGGDYGSYNSGPLQQTGFNQGNFGGHQQSHDYRRGYGFRGRGRGRGGYQDGFGRGRFQGQQNFAGMNQGAYQQHGMAGATQGQGGVTTDDATREPGADEHGESKTDQAGLAGEGGAADAGLGGQVTPSASSQVIEGAEMQGHSRPTTATAQGEHAKGYAKVLSVANPDVPINAPTGPKAMRQGLPNTSVAHLRARGFLVEERTHSRHGSAEVDGEACRRQSRNGSPAHGVEEPAHYRERSRGRDEHDGSRRSRSSVSRSRSRTRSPRRKSSRRHRRERSASVEDDEHRARRRHKSRKHSSRARDEEEGRSRSASPEGSRRSSHRSRRERDSDRRKDRRDEDRRRRHHREDRDRDRDRDRERGRDREKERDRKERRDRDRDRDRERRHRSRKHTPEPDPRPEKGRPEKPDKPTDSLHTFFPGIERMGSKSKAKPAPDRRGSSGKDPHTMEREARDRERLVRETQRMAMMAGGKRGEGRGRGRREEDKEE